MQIDLRKFIILIPTFCPPEKINSLIRELHDLGFKEIVIVDDGSPKNYNSIIEKISVSKIIRLEKNFGKGYALKVGLRYICKMYTDKHFIITCDDDGQHSPQDIYQLARIANASQNTSVFLGCRKFESNIPLKSLIGNNVMRFLVYLFYRKKLMDTQTGLRCISVENSRILLNIPDNNFSFEMASLIMFIRKKIKIVEVPIQTIYFEGNKLTRFKSVHDSIRVLKCLVISYFNRD